MKRTIGGNDLVSAVESKFSVSASQFYRPFISFSTAITKENPIKTAILN